MASEVTIQIRPHEPVSFPPVCCYCLEPATTTYPVAVHFSKLRISPHARVTSHYQLQMPYCTAHRHEADIFEHYANRATVTLFIVGVILLTVIEFTLNSMLRAINPVLWFSSLVLIMVLLTLGGVGVYLFGRTLLQRRHPSMADYSYDGTLGVKTTVVNIRRNAQDFDPKLAITFIFSNSEFATQFAALHQTDVREVQVA